MPLEISNAHLQLLLIAGLLVGVPVIVALVLKLTDVLKH